MSFFRKFGRRLVNLKKNLVFAGFMALETKISHLMESKLSKLALFRLELGDKNVFLAVPASFYVAFLASGKFYLVFVGISLLSPVS